MDRIASIIVGRMGVRPFRLSNAHRAAGIIEVLAQNYNGSYLCIVDLNRVNLKNTKANPRRHSKAHGNKLKADWNDMCVRNPILRFNDGILTSIDGRHTTYELIGGENHIMTCDVHMNITDSEAARIFHDLTVNSKRISLWDAFACATEAEMKHAIEINASLGRYNLTTPNDEGYNENSADIKSYSPIFEAWAAKNGVLDKLCYILDQAYRDRAGRVQKEAKSVGFLRGLIDFIQADGMEHHSPRTIVARLKRRDACKVFGLASNRMHDTTNSESPNRGHYAYAFRQVFNMPSNG